MRTSKELEKKLRSLVDKGIIVPRTENNQYLKVSYRGSGKLISPKWNVKIYTSGALVSNDCGLLQDILNDRLKEPDNTLKVLKCDDAGIGFPLCGIAVGVTDEERVEVDYVPVEYFQSPKFEKKEYLYKYAELGMKIITEKFKAGPKTHRIEICTGFINTQLKDHLRRAGFDVRGIEITGLLQNTLEDRYKHYVKEMLKADLAYDPKEIKDPGALGRKFYAVLNWGKKYAPHMLKSGWQSMK